MDARFIIRSCLGMIAVVEVGDGGVVGDLPGGHFSFEGFECLNLLLNFVDVIPKGFPHGIDFYTFFSPFGGNHPPMLYYHCRRQKISDLPFL